MNKNEIKIIRRVSKVSNRHELNKLSIKDTYWNSIKTEKNKIIVIKTDFYNYISKTSEFYTLKVSVDELDKQKKYKGKSSDYIRISLKELFLKDKIEKDKKQKISQSTSKRKLKRQQKLIQQVNVIKSIVINII